MIGTAIAWLHFSNKGSSMPWVSFSYILLQYDFGGAGLLDKEAPQNPSRRKISCSQTRDTDSGYPQVKLKYHKQNLT